MNSRILPLMGIIGLAWALVFFGSYMIFGLIVPFEPFPENDHIFTFLNSLLKVVLSAILALVWIVIMIELRNLYIKRNLSA
ncbi:MAG: hypothetical protein HXX80_03490 [Nitrososphaerales archaeon]|nr:hypothetical protein [Nitrososphaerales archaeon]